MTEFQSNGKHYLAVTVPKRYLKHVNGWEIQIAYHETFLHAVFKDSHKPLFCTLPKSQYSILGLASEMSEGQWAGIFKQEKDDEYDGDQWFSVKQYGLNKLRSLNMSPETTLIIEKR